MSHYFTLQWHVTERCDQRCKHCYIFNGNNQVYNELNIDDMEKVINDFILFCNETQRTPSVSVTGGDPLLFPKIWDFLTILNKHKIRFSILGNPFHLNDSVASRLKGLGCYNYQMSLDGLEKTHDYIRSPGSFRATIEKIACLNATGLYSSIMTTISKTNINEIPELVPIIVDSGVKNFGFARYCPNPNDIENIVSPEEYKNFLEKMWNLYIKYQDCGTRFSLKEHLWKLFLYEKGLFKIDYPKGTIYDGCHCGITHMTILSDGTVYACRRCESKIGKVPEESLKDIFFGAKMNDYRRFDQFEKCGKCELISFCRGCPAVAKCYTGSFYASDPQCWKDISAKN